MKLTKPITVLFTGYAPVHFLCFRPLYEQLLQFPGVEVYLSGGLRSETEQGFSYDRSAMYAPFHIPSERILSVEEIQKRHFDLLFSANKRIITPPENIGTKIQIFHGVSFRNRGVRPENLAYDFFLLIGPYMRRKFVETGLLAPEDPRGVPIGFPKTDPLLRGEFDRGELLARYGLDGKRPILLYAPTGQAHNSLETMGKEVIRRLWATGKYDLLIKPHDHPKNAAINWFAELAPIEDAHTQLVRSLDIIPLLFLADLLITDASSVANEYALLNRPLVFLDVPELIQEAKEQGALVDLDTWGRRAGLVVENPEQVEEVVATSLAESDRFSEIRTAIAKDLFYNPGHATDAAILWFKEHFLKGIEE
ncbi:MAG: CDP-glycerol glycerophosphotransferase family protein [Xenococcaceae cyanobacterium]